MATKRDPKRLHPVAIRLDDEMLEELRAHAVKQHRPMANLIAAIIKDWLEQQREAQK